MKSHLKIEFRTPSVCMVCQITHTNTDDCLQVTITYIGYRVSSSLHEVTVLLYIKANFHVTVFSTSAEFVYPSQRRGTQLNISKNSYRSKFLKNRRVSFSINCLRLNAALLNCVRHRSDTPVHRSERHDKQAIC